MRFGIRKPSFKKSFAAKTTGKLKRKLKKSVNPLYGKKGMGFLKSPKASLKNKIYKKTTVSVKNIVNSGTSSKHSKKVATTSIKPITCNNVTNTKGTLPSITRPVSSITSQKGTKNMKCPICNKDYTGSNCPNCPPDTSHNTPSPDTSPQKGFALLGWRSGKTWKKVLSIIYLAHVGVIGSIFLLSAGNGYLPDTDVVVNGIVTLLVIILFLVPYILLSRTPIKDKLPLIKSKNVFKNILGCAIAMFILLIISLTINSFHTDAYKEDQKDHDFETISETQPTCENAGSIEKLCSFCGLKETQNLPAKGHKYTEVSRKEPTEFISGSITEKCDICGKTSTKTIPKIEETSGNGTESTHTEETTKGTETTEKPESEKKPETTKAPDTTKEPETTKIPESTKAPETQPIHIHSFTDATCTTPRTCYCGATDGSAKGHIWNEATCNAPKTCSACKITEGLALAHVWKDATYSSPKTCTLCGKTEGNPLDVPGKENYHGHVYTGGPYSEKFHYEAQCAGKKSHEITWEEVERRNLGPCGTCVLK